MDTFHLSSWTAYFLLDCIWKRLFSACKDESITAPMTDMWGKEEWEWCKMSYRHTKHLLTCCPGPPHKEARFQWDLPWRSDNSSLTWTPYQQSKFPCQTCNQSETKKGQQTCSITLIQFLRANFFQNPIQNQLQVCQPPKVSVTPQTAFVCISSFSCELQRTTKHKHNYPITYNTRNMSKTHFPLIWTCSETSINSID